MSALDLAMGRRGGISWKAFRWALLCLLCGFALVAGACTQPARANQVPIAQISATPDAGAAPLEVAFSSAGSIDPDGTIASYSWDFGDGSALSTDAEPDPHLHRERFVHREADGDGQPELHRGGPEGHHGGSGGQRLADRGDLGDAVVGQGAAERDADRLGFVDPDGEIASAEWDFGDDTPVSSELDTFHEFTDPGIYTVTLTVIDDGGRPPRRTKVITVNANQAPTAVARRDAVRGPRRPDRHVLLGGFG